MKPMFGDVVVGSRVMCEDIRQDTNGKYILTGVIAHEVIGVPLLPLTFPVSFYLEFYVPREGKYAFNLRLSGPGDESATLRANLETHGPNTRAVLTTPRIEVLAEREGVFRLDVGTDDDEYQNIISREIQIDESAQQLQENALALQKYDKATSGGQEGA